MPLSILTALAIVAVATGTVAGGMTLYDMSQFDLTVKVHDAVTGAPIADATVVVKDANSKEIAQGQTDEDGEYELSVGEDGSHDSDSQVNESQDEMEMEDNATLNNVVGPLTVTVSANGYVTQTFTVNFNTLDDGDLKVNLQPAV